MSLREEGSCTVSQSMDKENIPSIPSTVKIIIENTTSNDNKMEPEGLSCLEALRTPLQAVNRTPKAIQSAKSLRRARYSLVTPVSTPLGKSPGLGSQKRLHKSVGGMITPGVLKFDVRSEAETENVVPLNSLVYKKVVGIVENMQKEHADQLQDQAQYIKQLETMLQQSAANLRPSSLNSNDVEIAVEVCGKSAGYSDATSAPLAASQSSTSAAEIPMTPIKLVGQGTCTSPCAPFTRTIEVAGAQALVEIATNTEGVQSADCATTPMRFAQHDVATEQTPVVMRESGDMTTPAVMRESGDMTTPRTYRDVGQEVTPVVYKTSSVMTSPFCAGIPRPSQLDVSSLDLGQMRSQLETASISNVLLRDELRAMDAKKSKTEKEAEAYRAKLHEYEQKCQEIERLSQSAAREEIDTLLQQQVAQLQEIGAMRGSLQVSAESLQTARRQHEAQTQTLQRQLAVLQEDLKMAYKQHRQQLQEMKEEQEKNDYKTLYVRAQQKTKELEAQLDVFKDLAELLPQLEASQVKLQQLLGESFEKVTAVGQDNLRSKVDLDRKTMELLEAREEVKKAGEKLAEEREAFEMSKQLLEATKTELESTISQRETKATEAEKTLQKVQELENKLENLSKEHVDLNAKARLAATEKQALELDVAGMRSTLSQSERDIEELRVNLESARFQEESAKTEVNGLQRKVEELQKCLDDRQVQLGQLRRVVQQQQLARTTLERDLAELEKVRAELQDLQEQHLFTEQELAMAGVEIQEKDTVMATKTSSLGQLIADNSALRQELQDLKAQHAETLSELDATKAEAHLLLLQQGSEVTTAVLGIDKVTAKMRQLQQQLQGSAEQQEAERDGLIEVMEANHKLCGAAVLLPTDPTPRKGSKVTRGSRQRSFVSQILEAIDVEEPERLSPVSECPETEQNSLEGQSQESGSAVGEFTGGGAGSAFTRVSPAGVVQDSDPPRTSPEMADPEENYSGSDMDGAGDSRGSKEVSRDAENEADGDGEGGGGAGGDDSLNRNLSRLESLVDHVMGSLERLLGAHRHTYSQLSEEIKLLQGQLSCERHSNSQATKAGEEQISGLESLLQEVQADRDRGQTRLNQVREQLLERDAELREVVAQLTDRTERMEQLSQSNDTKQERRLVNTLRLREAELAALGVTLNQELSRLANSHGDVAATAMKEVIRVRKENAKLQEKTQMDRDDKDSAIATMARRMEVYKTNWQKAEHEVFQLDELIERIRCAMKPTLDIVHCIPKMKPLLKELYGTKTPECQDVESTPAKAQGPP